MAQRAIREADGKMLMRRFVEEATGGDLKLAIRCASLQVRFSGGLSGLPSEEGKPWVDFTSAEVKNPWLGGCRLVVKPDQLIKRRGKGGLLLLDASWEEAKAWISERAGTTIEVDGVTGRLEHFIVEPFLPHEASDEYYVCVQSIREADEILFYHEVGPARACQTAHVLEGAPAAAPARSAAACVPCSSCLHCASLHC